jgi:hypothetical protein
MNPPISANNVRSWTCSGSWGGSGGQDPPRQSQSMCRPPGARLSSQQVSRPSVNRVQWRVSAPVWSIQ